MQKFRPLLLLTLAFGLGGCASLEGLVLAVNKKPGCCASFKEIKYDSLSKGAPTPLVLNSESPTFSFPAGKSYFQGFIVSPENAGKRFVVLSSPVGSHLYCSAVTFLNENFEVVGQNSDVPSYRRTSSGGRFVSEFRSPVESKYVIFHSNTSSYGVKAQMLSSPSVAVIGKALVLTPSEKIDHPCGPIADATIIVQ